MNPAMPLRVACVVAPPSSSNVTSSPVTALMTSGPVMNMFDVPFTMKMKSVMGQQVRLDERAGVQEEFQPLPRGELAPGVLAFDRLRAASVDGLGLPSGELLEPFLHGGAVVWTRLGAVAAGRGDRLSLARR